MGISKVKGFDQVVDAVALAVSVRNPLEGTDTAPFSQVAVAQHSLKGVGQRG